MGNEPQTFRERLPNPALASHLTCAWVQEIAPDAPAYRHRTVPHGAVELLCVLGSTPRVVGPQTGATEELLAPGTTVIGVRFRPGAAPAALGVPAAELVNLDLGAEELWGRAALRVGEALAEYGTPAEAAAALEGAIAHRLADAPTPDLIAGEVARRLMPAQPVDVRSLAASLFISERQLRRRCEAAIGFTPRTLHRLLRFQRFLALVNTRERPDAELARLALEAGYADQAHLTRESLRIEGRSPLTLVREIKIKCNCGHDHSASHAPLLQAA
jgi:AraC-like DNA-binding protein